MERSEPIEGVFKYMIQHRQKQQERVFIIGIRHGQQSRDQARKALAELQALVDSTHSEIIQTFFCDIDTIRSATFLGSGKVREIRAAIDLSLIHI